MVIPSRGAWPTASGRLAEHARVGRALDGVDDARRAPSPSRAVPGAIERAGASIVSAPVKDDLFGRPGHATISACIVCRNEADRIGPCLESVAWVDEVLVMDLSSTDGSADLARSRGARVITRTPHPIVEPLRNEIAAVARGDWILALDPDERVSPGLATALRELVDRPDLDAVVIPRMNYDLGYPPSAPGQRYEPQLRLYRRAAVQWPTMPNTLPVVPRERKHVLPSRDDLVLVHDRSRNIPEVLDRVLRYAPVQAQSMIDQGQVFTARAMLKALWSQVDKEFFAGRAWRDGVPGMLRAGILVAFKFYVWAAFWQLSGARRTPDDDRLLRRLGRALEVGRGVLRRLGLPRRVILRLRRGPRGAG
jgi:glycosyltransferase involved in cell wall biosynthesis